MNAKYIGTKLDGPEYLSLGIEAAKSGTSKSALLKGLVLDFLSKSGTAPTPRKTRKKEGVPV